MKNRNLWLTFLATTGIVFLLTWIIPATNYDNSGALALGTINPTGAWDIFYYSTMLLSWFGQNVLFILMLGIFYGIINKTGALRVLEEKIANRFKKNEKIFLLISSSFFIIVASLTGITFPLLVFVPFAMGIILSLGFNKITSLIATVASILVGVMGSLYATNLYSSIANYVKPGVTYGWYKLALIVAGLVIVGLYLFLTAKTVKGKEKEEINEDMLFIEKNEASKTAKVWPLIVAFSVVFVLYVIGLTPWASMYSFNWFNDLHTNLMGVKIGSFAIFKSLLGNSVGALGTWDIMDAIALLLVISFVLVLIYKIKWEEVYKNALAGITKLLPVAIFVLLANLAFVIVSQSGALNTIIKSIASITKDINPFTYSLASLLGGALVTDTYITSYVTGIFNSMLGTAADVPLLVFIQQVMYGLAMLIAPTSTILMAGLAYTEVGYTKWVKGIWKLLLILVAVGLIAVVLATLL